MKVILKNSSLVFAAAKPVPAYYIEPESDPANNFIEEIKMSRSLYEKLKAANMLFSYFPQYGSSFLGTNDDPSMYKTSAGKVILNNQGTHTDVLGILGESLTMKIVNDGVTKLTRQQSPNFALTEKVIVE